MLKEHNNWLVQQEIARFNMYSRLCGGCGSVLTYLDKAHFERAESAKSMCRKCANTRTNKTISRTGSENGAWTGYKNVPGKVFSRLKHGAKQRNIFFDLTIEDIYNKYQEQLGLCAFTNKLLKFGEDASIDRIDSTQGYYYDNIQIVHKVLNMMKKDMDNEDFLSWCRRVNTRSFE